MQGSTEGDGDHSGDMRLRHRHVRTRPERQLLDLGCAGVEEVGCPHRHDEEEDKLNDWRRETAVAGRVRWVHEAGFRRESRRMTPYHQLIWSTFGMMYYWRETGLFACPTDPKSTIHGHETPPTAMDHVADRYLTNPVIGTGAL